MPVEDTGTKTWNRYECKSCQHRQGETYMQREEQVQGKMACLSPGNPRISGVSL